MADPVAIISVIGSSTVGLAGVLTTFSGARAARRWQSREERVAELRAVLDTAATNMAAAMQPIALANVALTTLDVLEAEGSDAEKLIEEARGYIATAHVAQRDLWATSNRLRVRRGPQSRVALALKDAEKGVGELGAVVARRVVNPSVTGYEEAWAKAEAAERVFYDAAATELQAAAGKGKSR